jgi:acyl carrier protein
VYILDPRLNPVPIGVWGELYIGGDGLARHYLNDPALTAERFISHPFSERPGARLYRTGDRARYLADGNVEFGGRLDHQVKIRGYRIEPGEVETALCRHPAVRGAVVVARENGRGNKRLVAYVVPAQEPAPTVTALRGFLKSRLPEHMVPSAFVFVDALPLTSNGKVDRQALPGDTGARPDLEEAFVAPRDPAEDAMAGIWAQVLGLDRVGIHDNFFDLGGHSLLAAQLVSRVGDALQVQVPLCRLFEAPTVAELTEAIERARGSTAAS